MTSVVLSHRPSLSTSASNPIGSSSIVTMSATTPSAPGGLSLASPILGSSGAAVHATAPGFSVPGGSKPVPMKLFATWEVDRTPPNCIPRLCSLTLTRLIVFKSLGSGIGSIVIAVKMEGSKRTLRSNEIVIPEGGGKILDTELELTFSLQYPHFVKRGGNRLHVMLQRRKRYKNRTILVGFKTLAVGTVDMCQVLQKQIDLELELFVSDSKNANVSGTGAPSDVVVGKVSVLSLSSQPVDSSSTLGGSTPGRQKARRLGDGDDDRTETGSEDEEEESSSPDSDSAEDTPRKSRGSGNQDRGGDRGTGGGKSSSSARQQNLKQKFIAYLKKFKVDGLGRAEQVELDREFSEAAVDPSEIDYLFDQLEEEEDDLSDSGQDTISVGSTPKPSLKPFFCSSRSDLHDTRMSVTHTLSGGGAIPKLNTAAKIDDLKNDTMTVGEHYSDDSAKDHAHIHGNVGDYHHDVMTDEQENELSDPPTGIANNNTTTTASSGDEAPRKDRGAKKPDRPLNIGKQQQQQQQQQHHFQQQQQQLQHKVLKERQSSEMIQTQRLAQQHQGIEVASANATRKALLEQLSRVLPNDVDTLPEVVLIANTADHYGARLAEKLSDNGGFKVVCATNPAEVRASLTCIVAKIQKFCNTQTWESHPSVKVALIGADDAFVSSALRAYVEVFSSKPPDWQSFVKFYVVPPVIAAPGISSGSATLSSTAVARYIASKDELYSQLFVHHSWRELLDGKEDEGTKEIISRIVNYINAGDTSSPLQLPVAEAMVTYKEEKSTGEESSQVFLPFLSDVRVGSDAITADADESLNQGSSPSDRVTPPSSPRLIKDRSEGGPVSDPVDLQLDYWVAAQALPEEKSQGSSSSSAKKAEQTSSSGIGQGSKSDAKRTVDTTGNKSSIKASITHMQVQRLGDHPVGFTMSYWLAKDKKSKATVIRLGKKKADQSKEREVKSVESITRLICLSKGHNAPLKVHIDGSEWSGVKFFQLSAQWQTHIKFFPVATLQASTGHSTSTH